MREILFRGKRYLNGEWVEGYYAAEPYTKNTYNCGYILENEKDLFAKKAWLVDSRTVGQFTSLTDKNGKKIFEGDIVKFPHGTKSMNGKIEYIEEDCIYYLTYKTSRVPFGVFFNGFELEIIGNIHDNPELLEEEEE